MRDKCAQKVIDVEYQFSRFSHTPIETQLLPLKRQHATHDHMSMKIIENDLSPIRIYVRICGLKTVISGIRHSAHTNIRISIEFKIE